MIKVSQLRKSYGSQLAVDGIEFSIPQGVTFGLLGPNGAGKSTTIGMLVGLIQPNGGRIEIGGGNPSDATIRKKIGVAPQNLSLYDNLTAFDNLKFFGQMYGLRASRLKDRIDWALKFSGLEDRAKDRVKTYSGGMKRRLNIAVGLIHEPELLLLDEPTVGVDTQSRNHILESIAELARAGLTLIYTTHYMDEVERVCDRVAIMDKGRVLANDTVANLIRHHGGSSRVVGVIDSQWTENAELGDHNGGSIDITTDDPVGHLAEMHGRGVRFQEVAIKGPTLEDVFLNLTGRSLRD